MTTLKIRDLPEPVIEVLVARASANSTSVEAEALAVLEFTLSVDDATAWTITEAEGDLGVGHDFRLPTRSMPREIIVD